MSEETHPLAASPPRLHLYTGRDAPWLLDKQARLRPDRTFVAWEPFAGQGRALTYGAFAHETRRLAAGLARCGLRMGDFVVIHMDNCLEFLLAWFACSRLGVVAVTTNTNSTLDELSYFVSHSGAVAAITQPKFVALMRKAAPEARWIASTQTDCGEPPQAPPPSDVIAFETLFGDARDCPVRPADADAMHSIMYTSGTTSRPKGVVWTHANVLWAAHMNAAHARLTPDDCNLLHFPLFHANSLAWAMLATLGSGGKVVVTPKFSASRFWDIARRHRCTWANMVMFSIRALESQPDPKDHHFRFWGFGGVIEMPRERWGIRTIGWFGMTETVSQCTVIDHDESGPLGAMGRQSPEYQIAVRRDDGTDADFGELGNFWVRGVPGVSLFKEYLRDPAATRAAFDDQGWFNTGDQVIADERGDLFFSGRAKDMLKVGAENVAALEIETVILRVPGVIEAAVVGKPDAMLDEVPVAFVVSDAPSDALAADIMKACDEALSKFKRPREVIFVEALPKGLLDKVLKVQLRARLQAR